MTSNGAQEYNLATIRELLLNAFILEELRRFCYDHPDFRPIVDLFAPGLGAVGMVDRLVEYCDKHVLLDQLLAEVKQTNPDQYARYETALLITRVEKPPAKGVEMPPRDQPTPPTPQLALIASDRDILTISHPVSLHLVRVPAGEFQMGSVVARDKYTLDRELPPHTVHLPDVYIGQYPVTNIQYQAFVQATGHEAPEHWEEGKMPWFKDNHPVVNVSWHDAIALCDWLSRETKEPFRLPTEAEWEKAARSIDGRLYPWGDEPPDEDRCNFDKNVGDTTAIGRYSPQGDSPYGCADMAGNVYDWCQSLYRPYPYDADDGREDLGAEGLRVLRGGAWWSGSLSVRCTFRRFFTPDDWYEIFGFRVCVAAQQE